MSPYVITRYDPLSIILQECPRAGDLLAEYGLQCVNCFANEYDTLETGAQMHDMNEDEMMAMIDDINTQLEKEWREENKK
jgi:hypothetical protein